jgi:protein-S-isoprenylcysteine O-methyltransferase Ste14
MVLLKTLIFTVVAPGTLAVYVPYWLLSGRPATLPFQLGPFRYWGLLPIALGALTYLRCALDFAFAGKGTPAPIDPPKELVVRGLYRYVRNPMYVGVLTVLLGEALLFESLALLKYGAVVALGFHLFVLLYEEPVLREKFPESYRRYCQSVGRWLPRRTGYQ